jgi:hypothetical protein
MHFFGTMRKKVEKFVFDAKRLYEAKNRQFLETPYYLAYAGKKKPHPQERAF